MLRYDDEFILIVDNYHHPLHMDFLFLFPLFCTNFYNLTLET